MYLHLEDLKHIEVGGKIAFGGRQMLANYSNQLHWSLSPPPQFLSMTFMGVRVKKFFFSAATKHHLAGQFHVINLFWILAMLGERLSHPLIDPWSVMCYLLCRQYSICLA